jgi:hypothetical protein
MLRIPRCAATIALLGAAIGADPAVAQFGGLFGAPPRPPSNVPNRPSGQPAQPLQPSTPQQQPGYDPSGSQSGGASIQSQPLPPPGSSQAAQPPTDPQSPVAGLPPGQRQPRGVPPGAAATAPQPGDEVITELPTQKIANPTAIFAGLDKITGRIISFDAAINETVQFGALQVTPRVCYTRPPTETPNTDAFIEVDEVTLQGEVKRIFSGWIFASSPGLHAVEHAIYDVWLTDCKGGTATVASTPTTPTPATTPPRNAQGNTGAQRQPGAQPTQQRQPPRSAQPVAPMVPPRN